MRDQILLSRVAQILLSTTRRFLLSRRRQNLLSRIFFPTLGVSLSRNIAVETTPVISLSVTPAY